MSSAWLHNVGQSGHYVSVKEHKRAVTADDFNSSASEHAWENGHPVD